MDARADTLFAPADSIQRTVRLFAETIGRFSENEVRIRAGSERVPVGLDARDPSSQQYVEATLVGVSYDAVEAIPTANARWPARTRSKQEGENE